MAKYTEHVEQPDNTKVVVLPENYSENFLDYISSPLLFVLNYFQSEGFTLRFHNYPKIFKKLYNSKYDSEHSKEYDLSKELVRLIKSPLKIKLIVSNPQRKNNASYFNKTSKIELGKFDNPRNYADVLAHELGHAIDHSIKVERGKKYSNFTDYSTSPQSYSEMFPILRNSKSYQEFSNLFSDTDEPLWHRYPSMYYDLEHDGLPSESYADLMEMRYVLDKFNIYDSTKKDNPFTQKHLDLLKKEAPNLRLFKNFDDEDIIEMMNTIAYNDSKKENLFFYAKKGLKLFKKLKISNKLS